MSLFIGKDERFSLSLYMGFLTERTTFKQKFWHRRTEEALCTISIRFYCMRLMRLSHWLLIIQFMQRLTHVCESNYVRVESEKTMPERR